MTPEQHAGIYARVSKKGGRSVEEQTQAALSACAANGWPVYGVYSDERSASRFETRDRRDWQRLLADLHSGAFRVLVLWEPSRGDRDLVGWSALLAWCRDHDTLIHVISHDHTYEIANPRDWKTLAEDGVDSAWESEKTSKRNLRTAGESAVKGLPSGTVTYGYLREYDPATRKFARQVQHPAEAPVVREIIRRLGNGDPVKAVKDDLNARGIPSPNGGTWHHSVVRGIALSRVYLGKRVHGKLEYDGQWPALVTPAEHARAVARLTDPQRKTVRDGSRKYLLSYLAQCGECGALLKAAKPRQAGDPVYKCSGDSGCVVCSMTGLDQYIRDVITGLAKTLGGKAGHADATGAEQARAEAERLQAKLDAHALMSARDEIDERTLAIVSADLKPKIAAAKRREIALSRPPLPFDPATGWKDAPVYLRKEVVRLVLERIDGKIELMRAAHPGRLKGGVALDLSRVKITGTLDGDRVVIGVDGD